MTHYYFYYSPKAYKILTLDRPIGQPILETLAHDFQASLNRKVSVTLPLTHEARTKDRNAVKTAMYGHKTHKRTEIWRKERDELIKMLASHRSPNYGSIRLTITANGI